MSCKSCGNCSSSEVKGCGSGGSCTSGSCYKLNTFDYLSDLSYDDPNVFEYVEVSFKEGTRKDFYHIEAEMEIPSGTMVIVDTQAGYDLGRISLTGELARLQLRKKNVSKNRIVNRVIRQANPRDIEKLEIARTNEHLMLIKSRSIANELGLDMKIGEVEFHADLKKATFYYIAEGRVDFRELVRQYAKEFRIKIEMKQIGSRQESALIGGIGACGRELCCSTWLSDFKTVTTVAARYQNIAINQTKLSGQCGRLKCCLNYELNVYLDALKDYPQNAEEIKTTRGFATLIKTDVFKGQMQYFLKLDGGRSQIVSFDKEVVKSLLKEIAKGKLPQDLDSVTEKFAKIKNSKAGVPKQVMTFDDHDMENFEKNVRKQNQSGITNIENENNKSVKEFQDYEDDLEIDEVIDFETNIEIDFGSAKGRAKNKNSRSGQPNLIRNLKSENKPRLDGQQEDNNENHRQNRDIKNPNKHRQQNPNLKNPMPTDQGINPLSDPVDGLVEKNVQSDPQRDVLNKKDHKSNRNNRRGRNNRDINKNTNQSSQTKDNIIEKFPSIDNDLQKPNIKEEKSNFQQNTNQSEEGKKNIINKNKKQSNNRNKNYRNKHKNINTPNKDNDKQNL